MDDGIEVFKKIRDACDDVIKAAESNEQKTFENALGRFMVLMMQLDAMK